jgi:chemotaxis protein methyltransferase WspC
MDCVSNFSPRTDRVETAALGELLAVKLGLDAESMGPSFLSSVARRCLHQSGFADLRTFLLAAAAGGDPWHKLVESVVVSETWFFRDEAPFDLIVDAVRANWRGHGAAPVRVLSCPCSTGEEAYSVAMSLIDAGLPPEAFAIDAADVSLGSLKAARAAAFRPRSFRGSTRINRARYFHYDPAAQRWRLKPAFREMVEFHPANLVSLQGLENARPYDIVLCRNLLIYLHAEARACVMAALRNLLTEDGILVVGHAEPSIAREYGFTGAGNPAAFAFAKSSGSRVRKKALPDSRGDRTRKSTLPLRAGPSAPAVRRRAELATAPKAGRALQTEPTLQRIRFLGDAGRMDEAIHACRNYVRRVPDSAEGYFLLGVLCGALKQESAAETALRRALYLEPDHAGALMHLSLIHDARSDTATAARLRARANKGSQP